MNFGSLSLNMENQRELAGFFESGRLPHALLLEGASPELRVSLGMLLAQAALCDSFGKAGESLPCGTCGACRKVQAGGHPDLYVAGGEKGPALRVDEIRKIRGEAFIRPNEAQRKVYVLLEAQDMTAQAQNALLKILEEPPSGVFFLLTAPSGSQLLDTVCSRVQSIRLPQQAPSFTSFCEETARKMVEALCLPGEAELLYGAAPLIGNKEALEKVLELLGLLFRDACVLRGGGTVCLSGMEAPARQLSRQLTRAGLIRLEEAAEKAKRELEANANAGLLVTTLCARLRSAAGR